MKGSDDMSNRDKNSGTVDDQSATYSNIDANAPWLDMCIGEEIQREFDISQHDRDTLRPSTNYSYYVPTEDVVFTQLFPHEVFKNMVLQTNLYAAHWLGHENLAPGACIKYWDDTMR